MSAPEHTLAASRFTAFFATVMSDENLAIAQGLRRRDPELLDQLIERYQHRLYRYLFFLAGNAQLAEDLFQETWIRVLERGRQYNGKSKFESWLFTIARNLVIDWQRQKKMVLGGRYHGCRLPGCRGDRQYGDRRARRMRNHADRPRAAGR